jgi:hypothetical protein
VFDRPVRVTHLRVDPSTQEPVGEIERHGHTSLCACGHLSGIAWRIVEKVLCHADARRLEGRVTALCGLGPAAMRYDIILCRASNRMRAGRIL